MPDVIYDERGNFDTGVFFWFKVPFQIVPKRHGFPKGTIISRTPGEDPHAKADPDSLVYHDRYFFEAKALYPERAEHDCPLDKTHPTREWEDVKEYEFDLFSGPLVTSFHEESGRVIVPADMRKRIEASHLIGASFLPIRIIVDQGKKGAPPFFVMRFLGKDCHRFHEIRGKPNACPFCGRRPLICPVCGFMDDPCPDCKKMCLVQEKKSEGLTDQRLTFDMSRFLDHPILEGKRWDGSDFVGCRGGRWFMTRRAVDWLLSVHAAPFVARPIRFDVTGMTPEQLKKLEAAKRSLTAAK